MEKPILIFYFNTNLFPENDNERHDYMDRLRNSISKNEEVLSYFLCGADIETRIECINPKLINGDEYIKIQEILDRNQKIVDNIINKEHEK